MKIIEAGHIYELTNLDHLDKRREGVYNEATQRLVFVNRETRDAEHAGTQTQEVLRALIDRTIHCDNCLRWDGNDEIIFHLRSALILHEQRALARKLEKGDLEPEHVEVDPHDGHFKLKKDGLFDQYEVHQPRAARTFKFRG